MTDKNKIEEILEAAKELESKIDRGKGYCIPTSFTIYFSDDKQYMSIDKTDVDNYNIQQKLEKLNL